MSESDQPKGRAIVTFGRSYQALAAVQSLGRHGIEVVVCDEAPMMMAQFSKYTIDHFVHPPAKTDPDGYLDAMEESVRRFAPERDIPYVLLPIHEQTRLLAEHRERFDPLIRIAAPQFEAINQVDPKHRLTPTATRLGLPIPRTWRVGDQQQLEAVVAEIQFPAFLKLPHTSGGIGLHRVESADELREAYRQTLENYDVADEDRYPIVQQAVRGDDYCVTMLLQNGDVKAHLTYRNVKTYPWTGGSGAIRETVEAKPLVDVAKKLLESLSWNGVAEVDLMWDGKDDGEVHLIEVNPRFWGGLFHAIESGVDYPWLLYQMVTTGKIEDSSEAIAGTRTRVPLFSLLSGIRDIRHELLDEMQHHCEIGVHRIKDGAVGEGLHRIAHGLKRGLSISERFKRLHSFFEENWDAQVEVLSTEDPQACLGAFFGLAGLIRNGELPEQFRRR